MCSTYKPWHDSHAEAAQKLSGRNNPEDLHKVLDDLAELEPVYDEIIRTAIHTVEPDNIATFLGKRITFRLKKKQAQITSGGCTESSAYTVTGIRIFSMKNFAILRKKIIDKQPKIVEKKISLW